MNILYVINYFIFSIFFSLFMLEVGLALISLFSYDRYKDKINRAIGPLWGVTGTFAIFYLVNFEISYPKLVGTVGTAYVLPLLVAAIFIILRNIFIAFSEHIGESRSENRFRAIYSISTILAAILLIAVLSSGISGIGISLGTSSINSQFMLNPFYIIILVSLLLLSFSLASAIVKPQKLIKIGIISMILGFALGLIGAYLYLPALHSIIGANITILVISLILLIISLLLQLKQTKYASVFNIVFILILINLFGIATYPYIFGTLSAVSYAAGSSIANASIAITLIGGTFVAVSMLLFVYLNYIRRN